MTHQPLWFILCRHPEKGRRDRRDSRRDENEKQGRKRNRNESEETEEIKNIPPLPLPATRMALPNCKPISVGHPSDIRYMTPSHHPTTPSVFNKISLYTDVVSVHVGHLCWESDITDRRNLISISAANNQT